MTNTTDVTHAVKALYHALLDAWNQHDAMAYAALFTDDANVVGFDGSSMNGRETIASTLATIFAGHVTAAYISLVREVRLLAPTVALLRAQVGMVPPGKTDLNPAVNAIQTMVAVQANGVWRIALFQNTPAAFHGRPDLSEQLSRELRDALRAR